jgi:5-methyltetrahydrofolate--homocysteine methyltransferase
MSETTAQLRLIQEAIVSGNRGEIGQLVQTAIDEGVAPEDVLNDGMILAMAEVGRLYECGDFYVPEMLLSAKTMEQGLEGLKPHLVGADIQPIGKVVAGTIQGDLHDIGKNIVCLMLKGAGFEVYDLGVDVTPDQFLDSVKENEADLIAVSALLTTTMLNMETLIRSLEEAGIRDEVKVIIGGAPINDAYARKIGADGFAPDASRAVGVAKSLLA